ncbi:hypothetical protein [Salinimicrobium catena]|nr:hypothetical protein [Salinimicrobium catena]
MNELLKGLILFTAIGLLYFLLTLFIEHLFWLNPTARTVLFWTFIAVEVLLFGRFIVYPLLKIFRISKGIDEVEASGIIGRHFPEVKDKLLNVLQLKNNPQKTDLLFAGIDQKAKELRPVPFAMAIDFRKNLPYLKYAAVPVLIILIFVLLGKADIFTDSYERVVNYKVVYEPPAPFAFKVRNENLKVRENETLEIEVMTEGRVIPENVSVHYGGQTYFMNQVSPGIFRYEFEPVEEDFVFYLSGNNVNSRSYTVEIVKVPRTLNLQMQLDFPDHTSMEDEVIDGTGNATVPEGTLVTWLLATRSTDKVKISLPDTVDIFQKKEGAFSYSKRVLANTDYQISTSNREVEDFEKLDYSIKVVKDEFPKLELEHKVDSLEEEVHYFYGKVSDDHGIARVNLIAFPVDEPKIKKMVRINAGKGTVGEFLSVFPDTLQLERGKEYEIFFEVVDNDRVNGFKKVRSRSFSFRKKTEQEEKEERLAGQEELIDDLGNSLKEMKQTGKELEELSRIRKEELDYKNRQRLENFLQRQKEQNRLMESYTEKLKRTLEKEEKSYNEELRKDLQERLDKKEEELREQEKLLEELEKYADKIEEEGLKEKLEKMSKGNQTRERSLDQLLELTKKYYVQEKLQKLANELEKLGEEQQELGTSEKENNATAQDSLNKETEEVFEELDELGNENEDLKKPVNMPRNENTEKEIQQDQKKASEELEQGNKLRAQEEQKKAGEKMMQMAKQMQNQMQMAGMQQMQEDVDMLRQILDNLLTFSFEQEDVMESFRKSGNNNPMFSSLLREQNFLKENFQHIDDSIYSLALRNQMITDEVTGKLVDVGYHLDKSLKRLAQDNLMQGVSSQQYVVTGANDLAYFLSRILGSMEQMMAQASGKGSGGQSGGMQLPDIIQKQQGLNDRMEKGVRKGEKEGPEEGGEKGGQNESEETSEELFRIFQEQQLLRKALEERLKREGKNGKAGNLLKEMEQMEKQILDNGFNRKTLERMKRLEHKLLELDDAELLQGEKQEREANTNKEEFDRPQVSPIIRAKEYFSTTEILNRQTLPLRQIYRLKVREYFERGDH